MVQTWGGEILIQKSWIFLVDHFNYDIFTMWIDHVLIWTVLIIPFGVISSSNSLLARSNHVEDRLKGVLR